MKTIINYGSIKDMEVEIKDPKSDLLIKVTGAVIKGFAEAWVKYATKDAIVSNECLCSSLGASYVREAMKIGFLERLVKQGYKEDSEVYELASNEMDNDMSWYMQIYLTRGMNKDEALEKVMKEFIPELKMG